MIGRCLLSRPGFLTVLTALALLVLGCDGAMEGTGGGGGGTGGAGGATSSCPEGQVPGPDGSCMPVGIQGCVGVFVEDDGLCHPRLAKCPAGTIPKFDEGCVPVGIPGCAPELLGDDGLCHPAMARCPAGTFAVPQEGCVAIDGPDGCGEGSWGNIPDQPGTVYVDPSSAGGGDGSKDAPVKTIAEALAQVEDGGQIALAAGVYDEAVEVTKPVTIAGRCASMVTIQGAQPAFAGIPAIVWIWQAKGASLRGVRLTGPGVGILASAGAEATIASVHVDKAASVGVFATEPGTHLAIDHVLIEETLPAWDGTAGYGLLLSSGAVVDLAHSALLANRQSGIGATGAGVKLNVTGSLVEGTLPDSDGKSGGGVLLDSGAVATLEASALVENRAFAVAAQGAGSAITASGNLIEGTLPQASDDAGGIGLSAVKNARLILSSNAILGNRGVGVLGASAGTEILATGNWIDGTLPQASDGRLGYGVALSVGARGTLDANAVTANHNVGLLIMHTGSELTASANLVEGTLSGEAQESSGAGVQVHAGARATLTANAVVANHLAGVQLFSDGTEVEMTSTLVEGTLPGVQGLGRGVDVLHGARLSIAGSALLANHEAGVLSGAGGHVTLDGTLIAGTLPAGDGAESYGVGIVVFVAELEASSTVVRDSRIAALLGIDAALDVTGCLFDGVEEGNALLQGGVEVDKVGDGLIAQGSTVTVRDTTVTGCGRAGLLFDASTGEVSQVRATKNRFGLVLQGEARPQVAEDNEVDGNSDEDIVTDGDLPVPAAPATLPSPP